MSLPLPWIDRIFAKLTVTYGSAFLARWKDVDLGLVKSDWMHELSMFERAPHAIAFALANLPEKPPSVVEFKNLCRQAPAAELPKLPEPKADPARVAAELAKLGAIRQAIASPLNSEKDWARKILARVAAGEKVSVAVSQMARQGLGMQAA